MKNIEVFIDLQIFMKFGVFFKILEILMLQKGYMADRVAWHGKMNAPFIFEE